MTSPNFYTPESLARLDVKAGLSDGRWVLARPAGWPGICLSRRLRAAWLVFTGRADVLQWSDEA